jgi:hypothetical protein
MITKQQFIENVLTEITIIKHLFEKIPPEGLDYKPTEKQRTTHELLEYLAYGPRTAVHVVQKSDRTLFGSMMEEYDPLTSENFLAKMDEAAQDIQTTIEAITEEDLNEELDLFGSGESQSRSQFLLLLVLESFVAYKMQLFLYIKSAGNTEIYTSNLWQGKDTAQ